MGFLHPQIWDFSLYWAVNGPKEGLTGVLEVQKRAVVFVQPPVSRAVGKSLGENVPVPSNHHSWPKKHKKTLFEQKTTRPKKGNEGQAPKPCKNNFNGFQKNFGKKKKSRHTPAAKSIWHQAKASPVIRPKMELTNQSPKMLLHALAVLATSVRA